MMLWVRKQRVLPLVVVLLVVMMLGYIVFASNYCSNLNRVSQYYNMDPVPTRRALAKRILGVQRKIEFWAGKEGKIDSVWALELLTIAAELDPRITTDFYNDHTNSSHELQPSGVSTTTLPEGRHVCPEKYLGRSADAQLQKNFVQVECNTISRLENALSIVLSTKKWEYDRIKFVIENIRKHYNVNIFVLTYNISTPPPLTIEGTFIKSFPPSTLESLAINTVTLSINTPFTFVAHSVTHFSDQSSLERLIRVLDDLENVNVVSGAFRNLKGHWNHGCLQQRMENYQLAYVRGYEHSSHECMYCDDVLGPFMVRTEFLKKVPLTESLEGSTMYRDWFLNIQISGSLVMACPDVMFFVDADPYMERDDWLKVAKKWSLQYIQPYEGKELEFSCEEAQITCFHLMVDVSSFLLPPCCRSNIRRELGYVQECAEELGVYYELQAGSLLGAVKTDGILPWDFDTDVITDCKDQELWLTKGQACMSRKGCDSKLIINNYWISRCKFSVVDITCRYNRTIYLPPEYRGIPTQIEFDGRMTNVKVNPGLVARNKYGHEYLKHAVHWRYSSSTKKDDGSGQEAGMWSMCKEPGFHACLDHFPVDGNLKFKRFTHQLH
ncbi:uncharacterized protein LOC121855924 [Homarus americanus]|uniref:uncharacterized protein LOC121855924 n=1 Tax=Homarus americanus TaxID=6706 RepID=UPI001C459E17|nr:uncharacterized protein LOC121855924 [Homarus americanus]